MELKKIVLNEERKVTLTAFIQDVAGEYRNVTRRPAVVVLPGGGYMFCSDREAEPVAMPYLAAGYNVFILRYSVQENAVWPQPLNDYEMAMEYIKTHAKEWNTIPDKIAVIGFSAGGHLAASAAVLAKNKPQAAILGYPVVNDNVKECEETAPNLIPLIDSNTCPCFLFATRTDTVVPIVNSIQFMNALAENGVSFESHIYSYGPHGFSTADPSIQASSTRMTPRVRNWVGDSIGWLQEMLGDYGDGCMKKPVCKPHVSDDGEAWLSLDCTIERLLGNPEGVKILKDVLKEMEEKIEPFAPEMTFEDMMHALGNMTLRDLLVERQIAVDQFEELDAALGKVPNI